MPGNRQAACQTVSTDSAIKSVVCRCGTLIQQAIWQWAATIVCNIVYDITADRMLFLVRIVHSEPAIIHPGDRIMPNARASAVATIGETRDAAGVVEAFLHASM